MRAAQHEFGNTQRAGEGGGLSPRAYDLCPAACGAGGVAGLEALGLAESLLPAAQVALPVQHVLSDELQQLFEQVRWWVACSDAGIFPKAAKQALRACTRACARLPLALPCLGWLWLQLLLR